MLVIDAHHHLWDPTRAEYPWLGPQMGDLNRTVLFAELEPKLRAAGITRTVLVQASDNDEDTANMLDVADHYDLIAAVVGWVSLDQPERAAERLTQLSAHPKFRGIRPSIHFMPEVEWLLRPDVDESLGLMEELDVPLDVVSVRRRHLELVPILSERHPRLRMVIDHLSKPPIRKPEWFDQWSANLHAAAQNPNVYAKLSGLFPSRGAMDDWDADLIRPYVDRALECFGASRLMFGSDWPICNLGGGFEKVWAEYNAIFDTLLPSERAAILGGAAADFYAIEP